MHRVLTRYIQNGRDSSKFKGCSPLQHRNGLISLKPAIAHICIYQTVVRKPPRMKHRAKKMKKKEIEILRNPNAQKQEFSSPSLQASLRCKTHAFFAYALARFN